MPKRFRRTKLPRALSDDITCYCDGGCFPNPGPGGFGFVFCDDSTTGCGGQSQTTNNRMEITAVLQALKFFRQERDLSLTLKIVSDSQYVVMGCSTWMHGWKSRGWSRKEGKLLNADLWRAIDAEVSGLNVVFEWCKGHAGNAWNEWADRLAEDGAKCGRELVIVKALPRLASLVFDDDFVPSGWSQDWIREGNFTAAT